MKRLTICTLGIILLLNAGVLYAENESETPPADYTIEALQAIDNVETAHTDILIERVEYINEMDKTDLESSEKRELRKEVRSIHKELVQRGTYIYISGTALVIIILLIILL
jgi:hypothetical protein